MNTETRVYKVDGGTKGKRILKFRKLKIGIWGWIKMFYLLK